MVIRCSPMSELVFKYICPRQDKCLQTKEWRVYKKHVARHVNNNELAAPYLVPEGLNRKELWSLQIEHCRAVNESTQEVTDWQPAGPGDLPRPPTSKVLPSLAVACSCSQVMPVPHSVS